MLSYKGDVFNIILNVGHGKTDGKNHIYALTENKRRTAGRIHGLSGSVDNRIKSDSSNINVSQDSEPVNKYSIKEAEENATDKAILRENEHFFRLRPLHGGRFIRCAPPRARKAAFRSSPKPAKPSPRRNTPRQNAKHPLSIRMHPAEPEARQEAPHPAGVSGRPASLPPPSSARRPSPDTPRQGRAKPPKEKAPNPRRTRRGLGAPPFKSFKKRPAGPRGFTALQNPCTGCAGQWRALAPEPSGNPCRR